MHHGILFDRRLGRGGGGWDRKDVLGRTSSMPTDNEQPEYNSGVNALGNPTKKLGGGVRSTSQKPYPIYDQSERFVLP